MIYEYKIKEISGLLYHGEKYGYKPFGRLYDVIEEKCLDSQLSLSYSKTQKQIIEYLSTGKYPFYRITRDIPLLSDFSFLVYSAPRENPTKEKIQRLFNDFPKNYIINNFDNDNLDIFFNNNMMMCFTTTITERNLSLSFRNPNPYYKKNYKDISAYV